MSWIPCGLCHQCPCICAWRQTYQWPVTITTTPTFGPPPVRLTDDEIERIAKRVAELLRNVTSSGGAGGSA